VTRRTEHCLDQVVPAIQRPDPHTGSRAFCVQLHAGLASVDGGRSVPDYPARSRSSVRSSADLRAKSVIAASIRRPTPTNANTTPIAYAAVFLPKTAKHPSTIRTVPAVRAGPPPRRPKAAIAVLSQTWRQVTLGSL